MDRSARPEIEKVRNFLEACAHEYPSGEVTELVARIRSDNDANFKSATFELILHAGLSRIGFKLQPHPDLPNRSPAHPDFFVTGPDGSDFYLEAVLASENNEVDNSAEARKSVALDALAIASHQNFTLEIESDGVPATQPSGNSLRRAAIGWLDSLNPDEVQACIDTHGFEARPSFSWSHEEWQVTLRPIPLKAERRGMSKTLVGILDDGSGSLIDAWTPIKNAIKDKGAESKYGILGKPFLVAVNFNSFHLDRIDEMQALYGQEQYVFNTGQLEKEPRLKRAPNGAWFGRNGPRYRRVSGLWIFNNLNPYTLATHRQTIYFNPWASHGLPEVLTQFPHAVAHGQKMKWFDGRSLREIFDLSEGWPE